jgi:hypothetical protein
MSSDRLFERAHLASRANRKAIMKSEACGCFHCGVRFKPKAIREWRRDLALADDTAVCPGCGIDSVIGSAAGFPITKDFLQRMHDYWFK